MAWIVLVPFAAQAGGMLVDEFYFHHRRMVPRWERIGHPLDTVATLACYAWILAVPPEGWTIGAYIGLAAFSSAFITKDEFVHARYCGPAEFWFHAALFVLHPVVLVAAGLIWPLFHGAPALVPLDGRLAMAAVVIQGSGAALFLIYQSVYWNGPWRPTGNVPWT